VTYFLLFQYSVGPSLLTGPFLSADEGGVTVLGTKVAFFYLISVGSGFHVCACSFSFLSFTPFPVPLLTNNAHQEPVPGQAWLLYLFFPLEDSYVKGKTYTRRSGMGKKEERKACIASLVPT
jgi:hypothetical protein